LLDPMSGCDSISGCRTGRRARGYRLEGKSSTNRRSIMAPRARKEDVAISPNSLNADPLASSIEEAAGDMIDDLDVEEDAKVEISGELRHRMISEAAYRLYAERGYVDGLELDDWLQAEAEVDRSLGGRRATH
jgi:hypothetical protein